MGVEEENFPDWIEALSYPAGAGGNGGFRAA